MTSRSPNPSPGANYGLCENLIPNTTFEKPYDSIPFQPAARPITTLIGPKRHRLSARSYRHARADAFSLWDDYAANLAA
ncbi:MAG: hypothetical protein B7X48_09885 [Acidiphilium sp. 34-60-192]|nr:MAG: hypothetical protein B7X48_09885 [Acidiphilium sp. 34-60-192]